MRASVLVCSVAIASALTGSWTSAQSVRDHTRPPPNRSTSVTETQATELTLTLTEAAVRPIQVWLRTAGVIDDARTTVSAELPSNGGSRVRVGQRVRAFSPESRSRMYQATVSSVLRREGSVFLKATLTAQALERSRHYVLEIVTEDGEFLSVPNEALIEAGANKLVYVQDSRGGYSPREVKPGVQGELFTQILEGLEPGEQVVTIGSFFIDAEHKLKGS